MSLSICVLTLMSTPYAWGKDLAFKTNCGGNVLDLIIQGLYLTFNKQPPELEILPPSTLFLVLRNPGNFKRAIQRISHSEE